MPASRYSHRNTQLISSDGSLFLTLTLAFASVPDSLQEFKKLPNLLICRETKLANPNELRLDQPTTHFVQLCLIQFLPSPIITLQLLRVELPLCQESNLSIPVSPGLGSTTFFSLNPFLLVQCIHGKTERTMCNGFSAVRCARNSFFTYESPRMRISGSSFRWTRRMRRYNCSGGRSARASVRLDLEPIEAGVAISKRWARRIVASCEFSKFTE